MRLAVGEDDAPRQASAAGVRVESGAEATAVQTLREGWMSADSAAGPGLHVPKKQTSHWKISGCFLRKCQTGSGPLEQIPPAYTHTRQAQPEHRERHIDRLGNRYYRAVQNHIVKVTKLGVALFPVVPHVNPKRDRRVLKIESR